MTKNGDYVRKGNEIYIITETPDRPSYVLQNLRNDNDTRVYLDSFEKEGYELLINPSEIGAKLQEVQEILRELQKVSNVTGTEGALELVKRLVDNEINRQNRNLEPTIGPITGHQAAVIITDEAADEPSRT